MTGCGREIGGLPCCTVIHGACEDFLWMLSTDIDLVVTDPPYGMEFVSCYRKVKYTPIVGDACLPVDTIKKLIEIPRLASYFFCRWDNLWEHGDLPKPNSVITWIKNNWSMGDLQHEHGRATECALFYPGPEHIFKFRGPDFLYASRTHNEMHPTQKPVELIKKMLSWYDFETVLDPYMGSGTTALAAMQMRKHFLGFEIDDVHFATACARINAQRGIVTADPDAKQPTLFG
jgi:site-specific DNA-methyltransferase (adenine-specific)